MASTADDFSQLAKQIEDADTNNFFVLAQILGRDPKADFAGADLSYTDLTDADFQDADLSNTNLAGADLKGSNFTNADLSGANLENANLTNALLNHAKLSNANLVNAVLTGADFGGSFLDGCRLSITDLRLVNSLEGAIVVISAASSIFSDGSNTREAYTAVLDERNSLLNYYGSIDEFNDKREPTLVSQGLINEYISLHGSMAPESYLKERVEAQIKWLDKKSRQAKHRFLIFRLIIVVLGAMITIIAPFAGREMPFKDLISLAIQISGATVALSGSILQLNQYQEKWIRYRSLMESLQRESILFVSGGQLISTTPDAFEHFVARVEEILAAESKLLGVETNTESPQVGSPRD